MLPGRAAATTQSLLASNDPGMRIIGLRMCRLTKGDVIGCVEKVVADPSAAVRREAAIALKGLAGDRANRAWAELASRHAAGDRWETEALGIGADGQWDGRLEAWLAKTSGPKYGPGGEIIWRSRGTKSAAMQCMLIADANVTTAESLALLRSLDFQDPVRMAEAVRETLRREPREQMGAEEKLRVILPEGLQIGWRRQADGSLALVGDLQRLARSRSVQQLIGRITRHYAAHQALQSAQRELPGASVALTV